jgi:hypothetical protein
MASIGVKGGMNELPEDDRVVRLLRRAAMDLEPDPLFRRRVRGEVLNRHVATREGLVAAPRERAVGRLGRAVLLASLTLAVSVSAAGAAAQSALPGELLYPMKLQIESIRLQLASGMARADLLSMALSARLDELERLATAGEWQLVATASDAVETAEREVRATGRGIDTTQQARLAGRIERLEALLAAAPAGERRGIERALQVATERATGASHPDRPKADASAQPRASAGTGGGKANDNGDGQPVDHDSGQGAGPPPPSRGQH